MTSCDRYQQHDRGPPKSPLHSSQHKECLVRDEVRVLISYPLKDVQQGFALLPLGCAGANLGSRAAPLPSLFGSPDWRAAALLLAAQRRTKGQRLVALDRAPRPARHGNVKTR